MSRVQWWSKHFGIVLLVGAILIGNGCGSGNDRSDSPLPGLGGLGLQAYVKASNPEPDDSFGFRVALSGNTLAVASDNEDSCATGINGDQANNGCLLAGAVYIFTRTNDIWRQEAYIKASNTGQRDEFIEVALSGDTLAVGAPGEDSCASGVNGDQSDNGCGGAGAVYVYTRTNGVWSQQAYIKASNPAANDSFGSSVALNGDTLVVSAPSEESCATGLNGEQQSNGCPNSGAVYVFTRSNGVWSQQAYVKASNTGADNNFGVGLALFGDTLAVGALLENSCASGINGDQTNAGCPHAGAVYIFTRSVGAWSQQAYVKASNTEAGDRLGHRVALSRDTLAVSTYLESSCATGINGDQANNRCFGAGAAYIFTRTGDVWSQQAYIKASNTDADEHFGTSIALSGDKLAVGAIREDSCTMGINGDQTNNSCDAAGAVYVFTRTNSVWSQRSYVKASNSGAGDGFGIVALSGDTLAAGAFVEESCASGINGDQTNNKCPRAGAVYMYASQ